MKKAVVLLTTILAGQFCVAPLLRAQPSPAIQWQRSFGGAGAEALRGLQQTADGGYILGGSSSSSPGGNKTSPNYGEVDSWVVRMDANGGKLWDRSFGGTGPDAVNSVQQTRDGGFILGGYSRSAQGTGNKTSPFYGGGPWGDFWVVRVDASGSKLWEQSFGGSGGDAIHSLQQTSDGGFILGGESYSPPSGNKTSPNYGDRDYWVVRLDASGNKLWEQTFGGSGDDSLTSLQQTGDGGFILGGYSASLPYSGGGNKTSPFYGGQIYGDFWVVRLDAEGNKLWDKSFGGSDMDALFCLEQTSDGGFILGGESYSPPSGDKTSPNYGGFDFWIVRLDPSGTKLWERSFGGSLDEGVTSVQQTTDGGFIVGGSSGSDPSGNKTSPKYGNYDLWVVRLDASGNKLWEQSFGGSDFEENSWCPSGTQQTRDGGFILGGCSRSAQGTGNKTSPNYGADDFWVVKLGTPKPPTFTQQPVSQTVMLGSNATFAVTATGFEPLSYQWWKDGANLTGQTATNLVLAGVQFSDAGNYWAVVTDVAGSATSQVATLTVVAPLPPTIARQPASRTAEAGSQTGFQVRAAGDLVLAYQWFFNGTNAVTGATTNWLRLTNVQPAHAGAYAVVVTNAVGAVTSAPAWLSVIPPVERRPVPGILLLGEAGSADPIDRFLARIDFLDHRLGLVTLAQTRDLDRSQPVVGHIGDIEIEQYRAGHRHATQALDHFQGDTRGSIEMLAGFARQRYRERGDAEQIAFGGRRDRA